MEILETFYKRNYLPSSASIVSDVVMHVDDIILCEQCVLRTSSNTQKAHHIRKRGGQRSLAFAFYQGRRGTLRSIILLFCVLEHSM